jgi:microcystin degradation protein MlrC
MRILVGGLMHETHTFSVEPTPLDAFDIRRGDELWDFAGTNHSLGGVVDSCRPGKIDLVPTIFAHASPSAPADRATFNILVDELVSKIADAGAVDGVALTLHGAMVADGYPDAEDEILRRVRDVIGPDVPVAVTLDLHANIGPEMVEKATVVVGYDTYPHVDANERAREAVELLARTIAGEIQPTMAIAKPPLLPVPQAMFTERAPMSLLFDRAFAYEDRGEALSITIAGGFPYADIPVAGMSFLAVTDNDPGLASEIAFDLAEYAWALRDGFQISNTPPPEAVSRAIAHPSGPVILVDVGDNIGGGTPGDGTVILAELLRLGATDATVFIADPEAVSNAFEVGVEGTFVGRVGGKTDSLHGDPVHVRGYVRLICDGRFIYEGPENAGLPASMGRTAVIRVNGVNLVLTSRKMAPGDLQQVKTVGIDPVRQKIIVVKAAVRWRGGYAPIAKHSIDVDTPGLGSVDLGRFEFQNLRRPIYPLDPDTEWSGQTYVRESR